MSTVTLIGAGQMASALTFPLIENGHEVRLVGSPLDDDVIARLRKDNYHVNLLRTLHEGIHYYNCTKVREAPALQETWQTMIRPLWPTADLILRRWNGSGIFLRRIIISSVLPWMWWDWNVLWH